MIPLTEADYLIRTVPRFNRAESSPCNTCGPACDCFHENRYNDPDQSWYWDRRFSDTSRAGLSIPKASGLPIPVKWRDDLEFWRLEPDPVLQWRGDITDVSDNDPEGVITILAADRTIAAENPMMSSLTTTSMTLMRRFALAWGIIDAPDPTGVTLEPVGNPPGSTDEQVIRFKIGKSELADLAAIGVNWTCSIIDGTPTLRYGALSEVEISANLLDPSTDWQKRSAVVSDRGASAVHGVAVIDSTGTTALYPLTPVRHPTDGVRIRRVESRLALTQDGASSIAAAEYQRLQDPTLTVTINETTSVSPAWPIPVADLIPGGFLWVDLSTDDGFVFNTRAKTQLVNLTVEGRGTTETAVRPALVDIDAA